MKLSKLVLFFILVVFSTGCGGLMAAVPIHRVADEKFTVGMSREAVEDELGANFVELVKFKNLVIVEYSYEDRSRWIWKYRSVLYFPFNIAADPFTVPTELLIRKTSQRRSYAIYDSEEKLVRFWAFNEFGTLKTETGNPENLDHRGLDEIILGFKWGSQFEDKPKEEDNDEEWEDE